MLLGNPADHLHTILTKFEKAASTDVRLVDCWRHALSCSAAEVPECFQAALSLVPAIRTRIESQGLANLRPVVDRWEDAWLKPFMPPDRGWTQHSQGLIEEDAVLALSTLAAVFNATGSTPALVGPEQTQELLSILDDARDAVRAASELPVDLRTALLDRLHDVQWALDHYNIHGAPGLQAALDRLGLQMARASKHRGSWRRKASQALFYGWLVFGNLDNVVADLDAGKELVGEAIAWASEAGELANRDPLELPAGDSDTPDGEIVDGEIVDEGDR